jgi:hypothetical protein
MHKKLAITGFVFVLLLSAMVVNLTEANPLPTPMITVHSPKNNVVYPSSTVQLSFTPIQSEDRNFTLFTYVIDGQSPVATNGTATLTDLPSGSHTLTIYCTYNHQIGNRTYEYKDQVAYIVYFSTEYSMAWITFTISVVASLAVIPSLLFFRRRQIVARLKGEKSGVFWLGTMLLVVATLVFALSAWQVTQDYLFPYWPKGIMIHFPNELIIVGALVFVAVGLVMMRFGTSPSLDMKR